MSYCLNPNCSNPHNIDRTKFCQSCNTKVLLAEQYRAIKLIGQGGFGRTLLAEDECKPSQPRCVIKQFYPQGQNNSNQAAELFHQEADRLKQLGKHPQIPELLAHFEQDNHQYIVQEFIDGQNLAQELSETGAFGESEIHSLLCDLLPVLQFIHSGGVIHRDIKPENIIRRRTPPTPPLLRGDATGGRAGAKRSLVLVDFGAAKFATGTALGKTGTTIGSAGYAAPEQCFGKAVFASDLYSLGVTCIYLLTQIEPFDLYDVNESTFVWRHYLVNNSVSDELAQMLDKMIQSPVKQRYQSALEVMQALNLKAGRRSVKGAALPPPLSSGKPPLKPPPQKPSPRIAYKSISPIASFSGSKRTVLSVAISPDGKKLASGSGALFSLFIDKDNTVRIWNIATGEVIHTLTGHSGRVRSVAFSPDGELLASGSEDSTIKLWDVRTGEQLYTLEGHSNDVNCVAFSPDGQTLASGSADSTIKLWDIDTAQQLGTLKGHLWDVNSVAFSSDGQTLASGSYDNTIKLWNLGTGLGNRTLKGHLSEVLSVAFSPDGQLLASGSSDETIKLWNLGTAQGKRTLKGHLSSVYSVAFSPDGQTLASGSGDNTIKLWDVGTARELGTFEGDSGSVNSVAFSPDGRTLASGRDDKTIQIWRVSR